MIKPVLGFIAEVFPFILGVPAILFNGTLNHAIVS
jgi:hypothetical protein